MGLVFGAGGALGLAFGAGGALGSTFGAGDAFGSGGSCAFWRAAGPAGACAACDAFLF